HSARRIRRPRCTGTARDAGRRADAVQQTPGTRCKGVAREGGGGSPARSLLRRLTPSPQPPAPNMATKVHMEALSPTMEEGRLVKWTKHEGDAVKSGDTLAEVETDKAVMELIARADGQLLRARVAECATVPAGTIAA